MLIGVLVFKELLTSDRIVSFAFFGAALILYSIGMMRRAKQARVTVEPAKADA
jgi:EamA domain-containing membrane protein RarD